MGQSRFESLSQELPSVLQALEDKRRELKSQGHKAGLWGGILFFIAGGILLILSGYPVILLLFVGVVSALIYYACVNSKSKDFSLHYKNEVIARVIGAFCDNATYSPNEGINEEVFSNCGLFPCAPDRYHTEDLIHGYVDKTEFLCAEVHAEERRTQVGAKGQTRQYQVDIFRGFLFMADFHKDFKGKTTILRDRLFKLRFGESRVKMENPDFENTFDVYSTDQVEARYLITPSMMERLLELDRKFGQGVTISFRDSTILIAIPDSKNHFEASIWNPITNIQSLSAEIETISALISIVDDLNLNTRIWSKE